MNVPRTILSVGVLAAILAISIVALVTFRPPPQPGVFTLTDAILVAAYFLFPALLLIAGGLLVIAVLLLIGAATERGQDRGVRQRRP